MTSSIHSEFDPPKHLSKEQIIDMARRYIKYWRIEAQSFESKWEMELTRKWNLAKETMSNKSEWQPIETAPKDGTEILSYHNREILYSNGERKKFEWIKIVRWDVFVQWDNPEDEYDWMTGSNFDEPTPTDPTHWMPLPKPPKQ